MSNQLLSDGVALRMFFTDPVFVVPDASVPNSAPAEALPQAEITSPKAGDGAPLRFKFFGGNNKGVLILVKDISNEVSTAEGNELLKNILSHLNLNKADYALLNLAGYPATSFENLLSFFKSRIIICFGVAPSELSLKNKGQTWNEGNTRVIFGAALSEMAAKVEAKKAFWASLKMVDKW